MEKTVVRSACPDARVLSEYVAGLLAEASAAEVDVHLAGCRRCRDRADRLTERSDSLMEALRDSPEAVSPTEQAQLASMIAKAQQCESLAAGVSAPSRKPAPPLSLKSFVDCLRKSGLMNLSEIDLFLESHRDSDSKSLAQVLVSRRKLTEFQARWLLRGQSRGLLLGNYIILERIAHGGMSTVFKARHRNMGRVVCLKVPHRAVLQSPEVVERFRREAKTLAALNHPNIIVAHDADETGAIPFLVMEYVEGCDLSRLVETQGPLSVEMAVALMIQVARALDYAHREGVVHRDIKPHNLLVDESGSVKILDMGLARFDSYLARNSDATNHASMTVSGVIMGTIDYMAPEQAVNCRRADHRSDIYSLGCTLYFLLTGKPLFSGETLMEKLIAHRESPAPELSAVRNDVSERLNAVVRHMLKKDPAQRYQSMADIADDLECVQAGKALPLKCDGKRQPLRRRGTYALLAAAIVIAAVAGVSIFQGPAWYALFDQRKWQAGAPKPPAEPPAIDPVKAPQPVMIGHPKTMANGGPGRALIVVPHAWFYEDQFQAFDNALKSRGIALVTASSQPGTANPKYGRIKPVTVDLLLDQVALGDFDAVVFLAGNVNEFTHKNAMVGKLAKDLIEKCLENGLVVASVSEGLNIIRDTGITSECNFASKGRCELGTLKGRSGVIVTISKSDHTEDLVQLVFAEDGVRQAALQK